MTNINKSIGSKIREIGFEKEEQIDKILPYQKKKSANIFDKPLGLSHKESEEKKPKDKSDEKLLMSFVDLNVKTLLSDYLNDIKNENSNDEELKSKIESVQNTIIESEMNLNSLNLSINKNEEKYSLDFINKKEFKKKENNKRLSTFINDSMIKKMKDNNLSISIISPKSNIQESIISLSSANNGTKKMIEKELNKDLSPITTMTNKKNSNDKVIVKRMYSNVRSDNKSKFLDIKPDTKSRRKTMGFFEESRLHNFQKNISLIIPDSENNDVNDVRNIFNINENQYKELSGIVSQIKQTLLFRPDDNMLKSKNFNNLSSSIDEKKKKQVKRKSIFNKEDLMQDLQDKVSIEEELKEVDEEEEEEEEINENYLKEMKYRHLTKVSLVYDSLNDDEDNGNGERTIPIAHYLLPDDYIKIYFDAIIFFSVIISLFYIPTILAFPMLGIDHENKFLILLLLFDIIIDLFLMLDIVINCFTAYVYVIEEQLITDFLKILKKYMEGYFFVDLISAIPFNTILDIYDIKYMGNYFNYTSYYRQIYLLRLIRLLKSFKVFLHNSFMEYMINDLNQRIGSLDVEKYYRLFLSLFSTIYSFHLFGCIFIFIGKYNYPNWITNQGIDIKDGFEIYIASIYFVCATIFSVGYGDIVSYNNSERFFNVVMLTIGMIIYSWMVSALSNSFIDNSDSVIQYKKNLDVLLDIKSTYDNLPYNLYKKIRRYLIYKRNNDTINYNTIYDNLPLMLKNKLIFEMYKPIIDTFVFFKNFDNQEFILKVILSLKPFNGIRGERLVNVGDFIEEIIFVKRGTLVVEFPIPILLNQHRRSVFAPNKNRASICNNINQNSLNYLSSITGKRFSNLFDYNVGKRNSVIRNGYRNSISNKRKSTILRKMDKVQSYVKLLEIGKSEHFGDIIMFLNKRSPLSLRVKSRKAELLFLMKTDAIEISISFPKIWRQILEHSLFNMQQIDKLINNYLKIFFIKQQQPNLGMINLLKEKGILNQGNINDNNNEKNILSASKKENQGLDYEKNNKTIKNMTSIISVNESNENLNSSNINSFKSLDEFQSDEGKKNKSIEEFEINESSRNNSDKSSELNNNIISEEFKNNENELKNNFLFKRKSKKTTIIAVKQKNIFKDLEICYEKQFTIELNSIMDTKINFVNSKENNNILSQDLISKDELKYKKSESWEKSLNKNNNDIEIDNKNQKNNTIIKKKKKPQLNIKKDNINEIEQNPEIILTSIFQKFIKKENIENLKMNSTNYEI